MTRRSPSRRPLRALLLAAGLLGAACESPTGPPSSVAGRFDAFADVFARDYPYFAYKQVDWDSLRAAYRPLAEAAPSTDSLVTLLRAMVAPLRDVHIGFTSPRGIYLPGWSPTATVNWAQPRWLAVVGANNWVQLKPNLGVAGFGDVAYIAVGGWDRLHLTAADLDAAMAAVRDARALIVDVRPNGGGDDALAYALAGRFSATPIAGGTVRYRSGAGLGPPISRTVPPRGPWTFTKPVVLLVGRGCFSSNESFIAAMATLPHVTVMGDTTGGGSGNPAEHALGGGWRYRVPRWIESAPDGHVIEWHGIAPDVVVPWDTAGLAATRDPVIEAAVAFLAPPPIRQR